MAESFMTHRMFYKNNAKLEWKDLLRKRCLNKLKTQRCNYLNKLRGLSACDVAKEMIIDITSKESREDLEIEELLQLQEEVYKELTAELETLKAHADEFEKFEEESMMNTLPTDPELICPICQKLGLQLVNGHLFCPCGVFVDTKTDCIGLAQIRHNWESIANAHADVCANSPTYSCMPLDDGKFLCMSCEVCDAFYILV